MQRLTLNKFFKPFRSRCIETLRAKFDSKLSMSGKVEISIYSKNKNN